MRTRRVFRPKNSTMRARSPGPDPPNVGASDSGPPEAARAGPGVAKKFGTRNKMKFKSITHNQLTQESAMNRFTLGLMGVLVLLAALSTGLYATGTRQGTAIQNTVNVTYASVGGAGFTTSATATVTVRQVYAVHVSAGSATYTSISNDTVYVPVRITNNGNGIDNYNLTQTLSGIAGVTIKYFADPDSNGVLSPAEISGGTITSTGNLDPGDDANHQTDKKDFYLLAMVIFPSANNGDVESVTITATSANSGTTTASQNNTVTVKYALITVNKSSNVTNPVPGGTITYTITLTNSGQATGTNVSLSEPIPANTTFSSATPSVGTYNSGTGIWTVGSLAGGSTTATLTLTVDVSSSVTNNSTISNTASVTYNNGNHQGTNSSTLNLTVKAWTATIQTMPGGTPGSFASDSAVVGGNLVYKITLTNNTASSDAATFSLPSSSFVLSLWKETNVNGQIDTSGTTDTQVSSYPASTGSVASGASVVYWAYVTVPSSATDRSTDAVTYTFTTGASGSLSLTSNTLAKKPILTVTKVADNTTPAPGENVTYTITWTNTGSAPANSVILTDVLPGGQVTYQSNTLKVSKGGSAPSTLTDGSDADEGSYTSGTTTIQFTLSTPVPGKWIDGTNYTGYVQYTVKVK